MTIARRQLGRTGADVTILGYGAMELRGGSRGPAVADEDAGRVLNAVLDGGINLIDTSSLDHRTGNLAVAEHGPLPADVYAEARRRLQGAQEA
jgi:aryl-alcohol dehydrogenase-like predicted oxidoreductase